MIKLTFSMVAVTGLFLINATSSTAQALRQGNVVMDAYYGFPNLYTTIFKNANANSGAELGLKIGGFGPLGLRGEYLVSDKIGVGVDIGYSQSTLRFTTETMSYNSTTGIYDTITYNYKYSTRKIGATITFNYHFISNDKIDAYSVFGAGYGNRTFNFESDDLDFNSDRRKGLYPVAIRIGLGFRYFFTPVIGANLAIGLGQGGIVNAGISARF